MELDVPDATKYNHFANASDVLVIQLKRFAVAHALSIHKSFARVDIHQPLQLQIAERNPFSEILINRNYSLRSYISHTGTLDRGHYCAHVKVNSKWYKCNDAAVNQMKHLGNAAKEAYLLFFVSILFFIFLFLVFVEYFVYYCLFCVCTVFIYYYCYYLLE